MQTAMTAGRIEKIAQIIVLTDSVTESGSIISLPKASSTIVAPDHPNSKVTKAPEMAPPNFCDMVPDEKIRPVDEAPNFCVA